MDDHHSLQKPYSDRYSRRRPPSPSDRSSRRRPPSSSDSGRNNQDSYSYPPPQSHRRPPRKSYSGGSDTAGKNPPDHDSCTDAGKNPPDHGGSSGKKSPHSNYPSHNSGSDHGETSAGNYVTMDGPPLSSTDQIDLLGDILKATGKFPNANSHAIQDFLNNWVKKPNIFRQELGLNVHLERLNSKFLRNIERRENGEDLESTLDENEAKIFRLSNRLWGDDIDHQPLMASKNIFKAKDECDQEHQLTAKCTTSQQRINRFKGKGHVRHYRKRSIYEESTDDDGSSFVMKKSLRVIPRGALFFATPGWYIQQEKKLAMYKATQSKRGDDQRKSDGNRRVLIGPSRAPDGYTRPSGSSDCTPFVCKMYKRTGYCRHGDMCHLYHDESRCRLNNERNKNVVIRNDDDKLPIKCAICKCGFVNPVVTICQHCFCTECALKHHGKTKQCFVCKKGAFGIFNTAFKDP